jgi:hypothetical protein
MSTASRSRARGIGAASRRRARAQAAHAANVAPAAEPDPPPTLTVLHETPGRLRLGFDAGTDADALVARLEVVPGVRDVRLNGLLACVVVRHDGEAGTRERIVRAGASAASARASRRRRPPRPVAGGVTSTIAMAVPVLPREWQPAAALTAIVSQVALDGDRRRADPAGAWLDATSLATLALTGQSPVVATSVLLRQFARQLAGRLMHQADGLLAQVLPREADTVMALREAADPSGWAWWPLRRLRAGDRVRLWAGDVVPVDGLVVDGHATAAGPAAGDAPHAVSPGDPVVAGQRLASGTLELVAGQDAAGSRLERLRSLLDQASAAREPAGGLTPERGRALALPASAAAIVFALTRDGARAAAMLQADPQQGLDLARPVAREAALLVLARAGLVATGLEVIERLARARTLVLQDTGVLAEGHWRITEVRPGDGLAAGTVRSWLAGLAGVPAAAGGALHLPDRLVREWTRHGGVLRSDDREVHVAAPTRLRRVWSLSLTPGPSHTATGAPRQVLGLVTGGRLVARVTLVSALRRDAAARLQALADAGFERVAIVAEPPLDDPSPTPSTDGRGAARGLAGPWPAAGDRLAWLVADPHERSEWIAQAVADGEPLVAVHSTLRDLVPPGSLGLSPMEADSAGPHGVLTGDPLSSLVDARRLAVRLQSRLRRWQDASVAVNAALMSASAARLLPPMVTTLGHHGFALLMLLDSLLIERLGAGPAPADSPLGPFTLGDPPR